MEMGMGMGMGMGMNFMEMGWGWGADGVNKLMGWGNFCGDGGHCLLQGCKNRCAPFPSWMS